MARPPDWIPPEPYANPPPWWEDSLDFYYSTMWHRLMGNEPDPGSTTIEIGPLGSGGEPYWPGHGPPNTPGRTATSPPGWVPGQGEPLPEPPPPPLPPRRVGGIPGNPGDSGFSPGSHNIDDPWDNPADLNPGSDGVVWGQDGPTPSRSPETSPPWHDPESVFFEEPTNSPRVPGYTEPGQTGGPSRSPTGINPIEGPGVIRLIDPVGVGVDIFEVSVWDYLIGAAIQELSGQTPRIVVPIFDDLTGAPPLKPGEVPLQSASQQAVGLLPPLPPWINPDSIFNPLAGPLNWPYLGGQFWQWASGAVGGLSPPPPPNPPPRRPHVFAPNEPFAPEFEPAGVGSTGGIGGGSMAVTTPSSQ